MIGRLLQFGYFRVLAALRRWSWRAVLRSSGGSLGRDAVIYGGVRIVQGRPGSIHIGDRVRILRNATINTLREGGEIHIGNNVHVGECTMITSHGRIDIEDRVIVGPYNMIVDVDHICRDRSVPIAHQGVVSRPIRICEGAWISSHCLILKGVTIGRGAVVGGGSVVTHDVPDFTIVVGVPARVLKTWGEEGK